MEEQKNLIWKDRKRVLGMPLTFTKYSLSEDRIFLQTGFLNLEEEEILLIVNNWQRVELMVPDDIVGFF